jgi:hypothetical protein
VSTTVNFPPHRNPRRDTEERHRGMARGDLSGVCDCLIDAADAAENQTDENLTAILRNVAFWGTRRAVPS